MDGILNILKPPGMTSFDVVAYLRGILKTRKIGHTGTLDPDAVGVLPVCVGNATKAIEYMVEKSKQYRAELTMGIETNTQDASGEVTRVREVKSSPEQIREVISTFTGKIQQIPPMFSAVKVGGKKLYELARSGQTIERQPREIEIYSINITDIYGQPPKKVIFDVDCSKGTYIRTLCADIGEKIGCGGHMSFLLRRRSGNFDISSALTLEEVAELADKKQLFDRFSAVDQIFEDFDKVNLNELDEKRLLNGVFIKLDENKYTEKQIVRVYNNNNSFFALGEVLLKNGAMILKSKKVFVQGD